MFDDEDRTFQVVVNHEEQYSIWPADREIPPAGAPRGPAAPRRSVSPTSTRCGPTCAR